MYTKGNSIKKDKDSYHHAAAIKKYNIQRFLYRMAVNTFKSFHTTSVWNIFSLDESFSVAGQVEYGNLKFI